MAIRIGSAASPRWYDLSLDRLDAFVDALVGWGASSTELVLHPGPGDEAVARVHVLERDWSAVIDRFQRRGVACHAHAPLGSQFKLSRWTEDREGLVASFAPVLRTLELIAAGQDDSPVLVLHAGRPEATAEFIEWAAECTAPAGARFALESRRPHQGADQLFDQERSSLAAFVRQLADERAGICWDVAHDWEGGRDRVGWLSEPDDDFLRHVLHVHLHGTGVFDGHVDVHFPLQSGDVPWRAMLSSLLRRGYDGAMTVEARYRYARTLGEPWTVLAESLALLGSWVAAERLTVD